MCLLRRCGTPRSESAAVISLFRAIAWNHIETSELLLEYGDQNFQLDGKEYNYRAAETHQILLDLEAGVLTRYPRTATDSATTERGRAMDDLRTMLEQLLDELDNYPLSGTGTGTGTGGDAELELGTGHPLCDVGRRVVQAIPDSRLDSKGTPNFPSTGGKLWYRLLRTSRRTRDESLLQKTADELSSWIQNHYIAVLQKEEQTTFDIFLSHNIEEKPQVKRLGQALQERSLTVWLDEWELRPGHSWQDALQDIVANCKSAAVCVGNNGIGPWEDPEMKALLRRFVKEKKTGNVVPIIPVLLPGAPHDVSLPLFLEEFTWVDLRDGLNKDGLDRLEWGITGVKPNP